MIRHHLISGLAAPISPSSHAVEARGLIFLTGQIGRDLRDAESPLPEGIAAQTRRALENVRSMLAAMDLSVDDVVSVRMFLTRFRRDYAAMNTAYGDFFGDRPRPSRTCVGVTDLVRDALVEIDCIALRAEQGRGDVDAPPAHERGPVEN